jgi:hypothetical protein
MRDAMQRNFERVPEKRITAAPQRKQAANGRLFPRSCVIET